MNDEEVRKQLLNMVNFITKEANEKANELKDEAEQEFNAERTRIVQESRARISSELEKKKKAIDSKKKIDYSNELNKARLECLRAREGAINTVYTEAYHQLSGLEEESSYPELLHNLILQALLMVRESDVLLLIRQQDRQIVTDILKAVKAEFSEKTGQSISINIDNQRFLPPSRAKVGPNEPSCAGGVIISANEGRIICNNTFEQRLNLAYENLLPEIRQALFPHGHSH